MKKLISALLFALVSGFFSVMVPAAAQAEEGMRLDRVEDRSADVPALQHGAKLFVNYCLSCHAAQSMRYNRLRDIGLTDEQIKTNLLFTADKVGETMTVALTTKDGKTWFGAAPPDLSVIARSKSSEAGSGADWLYNYLRSFYRDSTRPTGWNNLISPNVAMPHVLYELQGEQRAVFVDEKDPEEAGKTVRKFESFEIDKPGKLTKLDYDIAVTDLVGFLVWMGEPEATHRKQLGILVLIFLGLFLLPCAWLLKRSYWKGMH